MLLIHAIPRNLKSIILPFHRRYSIWWISEVGWSIPKKKGRDDSWHNSIKHFHLLFLYILFSYSAPRSVNNKTLNKRMLKSNRNNFCSVERKIYQLTFPLQEVFTMEISWFTVFVNFLSFLWSSLCSVVLSVFCSGSGFVIS